MTFYLIKQRLLFKFLVTTAIFYYKLSQTQFEMYVNFHQCVQMLFVGI